MNYYLDTNICIFFLRGKSSALLRALLSHAAENVKIPAVVASELPYGACKSTQSEKNMQQVREFLETFEIVPFGAVDTASYGEIRAALERRATEDYKHAVIGPSGRVALVVPSRVKGVEKPCQGQLS